MLDFAQLSPKTIGEKWRVDTWVETLPSWKTARKPLSVCLLCLRSVLRREAIIVGTQGRDSW